MGALPGPAGGNYRRAPGVTGRPQTCGQPRRARILEVVETIARAQSALVRRAFPGPWNVRRVVREVSPLLGLALAALLLETGGRGGPVQIAAVGLMSLALFALRRVLPAPVFVAAAAGAGATSGYWPLLVCASWSAGVQLVQAATLIVTFAAGLLLYLAVHVWVYGSEDMPGSFVSFLLFIVLAVLPGLVARSRDQQRTLLATLRERNEQLLRERAMVIHQARLRERHRIAQDMHDSLGHQLTLIAVHTGALEVDAGLQQRHTEAVGVLRQAATTAMHELRAVVGVLRDEEIPEATGDVGDVGQLIEASCAVGTAVEFRHSGEERPLPAAASHAAYRIVQEALTNAHKHAPAAAITVELRYEPDSLVVEVINGPAAPTPVSASAPPPVSGGQGLPGLRERARLAGGLLHAGPTADGGFRVAGVLPYAQSAPAASDSVGSTDVEPAAGSAPGEAAAAVPPGGWRHDLAVVVLSALAVAIVVLLLVTVGR